MLRGGKLASVNWRGQWQMFNLGGMAHLLWANQLSLESVAGVGPQSGPQLKQEALEYHLGGAQSQKNGGSPGRRGPCCYFQSGLHWAGTRRSTGHGWGPAGGTGTSAVEAGKAKPPAVTVLTGTHSQDTPRSAQRTQLVGSRDYDVPSTESLQKAEPSALPPSLSGTALPEEPCMQKGSSP